jgi:hypothetical protein
MCCVTAGVEEEAETYNYPCWRVSTGVSSRAGKEGGERTVRGNGWMDGKEQKMVSSEQDVV